MLQAGASWDKCAGVLASLPNKECESHECHHCMLFVGVFEHARNARRIPTLVQLLHFAVKVSSQEKTSSLRDDAMRDHEPVLGSTMPLMDPCMCRRHYVMDCSRCSQHYRRTHQVLTHNRFRTDR